MSNLKVGDRVRHTVSKKDGKVLSIHLAFSRQEWYIRVLAKKHDQESVCVWNAANVKPIVTVRG